MSGVRTRSRVPIFLTVTLIAFLWTVPTLGIVINSFRDPQSIRASGWWTVFPNVFDQSWTLENYRTVLDGGFSNAFANTLAQWASWCDPPVTEPLPGVHNHYGKVLGQGRVLHSVIQNDDIRAGCRGCARSGHAVFCNPDRGKS